ncbi:M23 family metallopeptidase [Aestuariibacter halophilus]|uniref:M23 family metallopeptidase n=1 Tax=Fluctibacter halophilus TaxID=226011 RepID=A0ABS8G7K2_9ALTE|nr:M23 family metallopeptidase [Aestuariibacter halophilus]MCC2616459.1 M23 family metallopeptidase [Aestuariibacter halophilus]
MALTVLYKGQSRRWIFRIGRRQVVSGLILACGLALVSSRSTQQPDENLARVMYTQAGLEEQRQAVEALKTDTQEQLTGMMLKLAEVQGQLHRINALGTRLVEQAKLKPEEFGFSSDAAGVDAVTDMTVDFSHDQFLADIDTTLLTLEEKTQQLKALESILMSHHIDEQRYLSGRPIRSGWLSSYYGIRKDPFSGQPAMHKGLDFAGKTGDPVIATGAGLVTWSGERYGYGNLVEIDHGDGVVTRYAHNRSLKVKIGDVVTKGQTVAIMGSTGRSTGAHVHYEVLRHGKQQDPLPFVYRKQ